MTSFEKIQCVYPAVSDCDKVLPNELKGLHESHDSQTNSIATTFRQVALCHLKQNPTDYEKPYKQGNSATNGYQEKNFPTHLQRCLFLLRYSSLFGLDKVMARLSPRQRQGLPRQQVDSRFPLCPKLLNAKDILRIPVTQTICLCRHQLYHNPDFSRNSENLTKTGTPKTHPLTQSQTLNYHYRSSGKGMVRKPNVRSASFFCSQTSEDFSFSSSRFVRS